MKKTEETIITPKLELKSIPIERRRSEVEYRKRYKTGSKLAVILENYTTEEIERSLLDD